MMTHSILPVHPRTGLLAVGIVAGRPVWPILGGAENEDPPEEGDGDPAENEDEDEDKGKEKGKEKNDNDLSDLLGELGLTPEQARARLRNAPKWEKRARENHERAQKTGTLEQQLDKLRGDLTERDKRDIERSGRLAMTQVREQLAGHGINPDDVAAILKRVKATDLLKDGEPDEDAISELAGSLLKVTGRAAPDPDQGKRGGEKAESMDSFIRRQAGRGARTFRV